MNLVQICLHRSVIIQKRAITQRAYNLFVYFVGYCFYAFTDHNDTDSVGACLSVMFLVQHVLCNVFGASAFTKARLGASLLWCRHSVIFLQMKIATLSLAWLLIGLYSQSVQDDIYQTTTYDYLFSKYRQVIDSSITLDNLSIIS